MRKPIIAANWKMNATLEEAERITKEIVKALGSNTSVEIVLCPPFTALAKVAELTRGSQILLGAQDIYWEAKGAYTGEISPVMLRDVGCRFCILGHSERRQLLGETDADVHRKLLACLQHNLTAILCVGETLKERQAGKTWQVVEGQLAAALDGVTPSQVSQQVVVAYEPVWAIGTGQNATPAQAQEVHQAIRSWIEKRCGPEVSSAIRIQYGGSVKPENAGELLSQPDVDGSLVGGASSDPKAFISIVESTQRTKGNTATRGIPRQRLGGRCSTGSS